MNNEEIVIPFDKEMTKFIMFIMFLPIILLVSMFSFFYLIVDFRMPFFLKFYIIPFINFLLFFLILLFLIGIVHLYFYINDPSPLAIINKDGVFIKGYGFIVWKNIKEFELYSTKRNPDFKLIGIRVKSIFSLLRKASFGWKMGIIISIIFGYYPISLSYPIHLSNNGTNNENIVNFAKKYINQID